MDELRPCPFDKECSSGIYRGMYDDCIDREPEFYYYVSCMHAESEWFDNPEDAARAWNTRPIEDELRQQLEAAQTEIANLQTAYDALKANQEWRKGCYQEREDLRRRLEAARGALARMVDYRQRNTLNFQLEKLDDYIRALTIALEGDEPK